MTDDLIVKNIEKHIELNIEEKSFFFSLLRRKNLPKKTFILKEGQICKHIYFVQSGTLRAFHVDKENKEATMMFAVADWWITDMFCFLNEKPAMVYIEAIEDCCIFQLSK